MGQPIDEVLGMLVGAQTLVLHQDGDDRGVGIHQALGLGYRPVGLVIGDLSLLIELLEDLGFDRFDLQFIAFEIDRRPRDPILSHLRLGNLNGIKAT